jgi:hypothetical protein
VRLVASASVEQLRQGPILFVGLTLILIENAVRSGKGRSG